MPEPALTRRQTLEGAAATGLASAATGAGAARAEGVPLARGVVFESRDASFIRRPDSPGVAGVMVSNGEDVGLTDAAGRWSLPLAEGESVFVVKPTGWRTALDAATGLPRDFYLHVPQGSPGGGRFAGVAPSGPLPASIDFGLQRRPEPTRFEALLITDPQPQTAREVDFLREALARRTAGLNVAFGIDHGDVVFDDLSLYERSNRIWGATGIPWYHAPGNHDTNYDAPGDALARETFKRVFGARRRAFQYGGATFLLLDNVEFLGPNPARPGHTHYRGHFGARQLAFVRNVLAHVPRESLVVAGFHIPLATVIGTGPGVRAEDTRAFLEAISSHPRTASFSGHTHTNEHWYFGPAEGFAPGTHHHQVLAAGSGSWWSGPYDERGIPLALETDGSPNGVHVLSVDGATCATRLLPARGGPALRVVLESPVDAAAGTPGGLLETPASRVALARARVVVNLFDGGPRSTVECALAGGAWQAMARVVRPDPFVADVYARNAATRKSWVQPTRSAHVWQADLAATRVAALGPGAWPLRVRASDEYGRRHEVLMVVELEG